MTLEEYKRQSKEIREVLNGFEGSQEEAEKLLKDLEAKYPELNEFNLKASQCESLENFIKMAKSYGMEFSSEESAKTLFDSLKKAQTALSSLQNGELDDDMLESVTGGGAWKYVALGFLALSGVLTGGITTAVAAGLIIEEAADDVRRKQVAKQSM